MLICICIYIHTHTKYVTMIIANRGNEVGRDKEGINGRAWSEERQG